MEKQKHQPREVAVEFIAPYSFAECLYRLELKAGKYFDSTIEIRIEPVDSADRCTFWANAYGRRQLGAGLSGYLASRDNSSTLVTILKYAAMPYNFILPIVLFSLVGVFAFRTIAPLVLVGFFIAVAWYQHDATHKQLLRLIQDTLGYIPEKARQD